MIDRGTSEMKSRMWWWPNLNTEEERSEEQREDWRTARTERILKNI